MKALVRSAVAVVGLFGFGASATLVVGCNQSSSAPASGMVGYKCSMASCTKTKEAKAGDQAPSC